MGAADSPRYQPEFSEILEQLMLAQASQLLQSGPGQQPQLNHHETDQAQLPRHGSRHQGSPL